MDSQDIGYLTMVVGAVLIALVSPWSRLVAGLMLLGLGYWIIAQD